MSIKLICAISKNNVIGNENKLPWNISEDLKRFKELTSNNWIVMGRKTFDSIGRPLPNRKNIVLSENKNLKIESVEVFNTPEDVIESYKNNPDQKDLFIIGGTYIYELFLEYCEYLFITYVDKEYLGDAFFPKIDWNEWKLIGEETKFDDKEGVNFNFRDYKRI
ncbi:dihydrofolate reductase [Gammaproteobacteria bacterium]|nr:dihydrofolate reductase [Gammaproteobacteria bacterium]